MASITLTVNGRARTLDLDPAMPLLWALRDALGLTGTKFGCGMGQCGACTVHLDGEAVRSCSTTVAEAAGRRVTTIEGLVSAAGVKLREAWLAEQVPQCGYCQGGQLMSAAALMSRERDPGDEDIARALSGNLCRCGTYPRIRAAIQRAAKGGAR